MEKLAAFNTMIAIKKKMHNMKQDKENAFDQADQLEQKLIEHKSISEKNGEEILHLQKRIYQIQTDLMTAQTQFEEASNKLEDTNKQLSTAETEVASSTKQVRLMEEDYEVVDAKLNQTASKLDEATQAADESERVRKVLEVRTMTDEDRILVLERELEATILFGEEADRKYEETARKLAVTEVDLERSESRLEAAETKIAELEEELKIVGNNMRSLEIAEQEAAAREETYELMVQHLTERLKGAEQRATEAERNVTKLQKEVDRLEDELTGERDKFRMVASELDSTFTELTGF